ncbi:MAG: hypothetical protein NC252_02470 [Roseburia sp.]|nr:hypothetical protein [Roseburia sp.]MCM1420735.1 hypothetical protein [Bacteroides sp.]
MDDDDVSGANAFLRHAIQSFHTRRIQNTVLLKSRTRSPDFSGNNRQFAFRTAAWLAKG